jgi:hypothetical protein
MKVVAGIAEYSEDVWFRLENRKRDEVCIYFVFLLSLYFLLKLKLKAQAKTAASIDGTVPLPNLTLSQKMFSYYQ